MLSLSCGRTGLFTDPQPGVSPGASGNAGALASGGATNEIGPDTPEPGSPTQMPSPEPLDHLPEICIATTVDSGVRVPDGNESSLVLVAPLTSARGPFELSSRKPFGQAFSPHGRRLAYIDEQGLYTVEEWPPKPKLLSTQSVPFEFAFIDDRRLVDTTSSVIELQDLEHGTQRVLVQSDEFSATPPLYLARPSPDGRWLAFAEYSPSRGIHQIFILSLETTPSEPELVYSLEPGAVTAWFDWAPNSEHLAFSVTDSQRLWLRAYAVVTRDAVGQAAPISFPLGDMQQLPTFQWSPDGSALQYLFEGVDPQTSETDFRVYYVDMAGDAPGASVLLSAFDERSWADQGLWSPGSDLVAFSANFAGADFRAAEFVADTRRGAPARIAQQGGEFQSVPKQAWAPDGRSLYFTAIGSDQVERLYKSNLAGAAFQLSTAAADTRGLYVSSELGCIAYSQFVPKPALTIVEESTPSYFEIGQPQWNNPNWTGNFDSSFAVWVDDARGSRGLLYLTNSIEIGDTLAWVQVDDCRPSEPEVLIEGHTHQTLGLPIVSTKRPWPDRE
ncbi:MAG TPA: hypothetical protein VFK05_03705 [Polyangiaceae bacterium]|nr:hypothetical protein [Polyangiaceae bacterium]